MEVIGSNNHLKDTKTPAADNLYSCHMPRDMNFGVNPQARSKGEADIGLLVACKVQLSSEVIKWKTENLRLMKELDSASHQTDDLKVTVSKLADRTKELEERLSRAEDENRHLKHRNATMDEEKAAIVQRISMGFDKYHSFPYSESSKSLRLSREGWKLQKSCEQPVEDYIQVSHCLLDKMKQEIQEFREMSCQYRVKDDGERSVVRDAEKTDSHCEESSDYEEELEVTVKGLLSETKSIKEYLFEQRRKLKSLMKCINTDEHIEVNPGGSHEMQRSSSHALKVSTSRSINNNEYIGHGPTPNLGKLCPKNESDLITTVKEASPFPSETPQNLPCPSTSQHQENNVDGTSNADHRICPICEDSFNDKTQKEFEDHVLNHLEKESASLLDQYVVI